MSTVITVIIQYSDLEMKYLKGGDNGGQNDPQAIEITIKHVTLMTCTIGGALEHQNVQNHEKLKCNKMHHNAYQIEALVEEITINTTWWCYFGIGCRKNGKTKKTKILQKRIIWTYYV